jgi:hypothetical protein
VEEAGGHDRGVIRSRFQEVGETDRTRRYEVLIRREAKHQSLTERRILVKIEFQSGRLGVAIRRKKGALDATQ